MTFLVYIYWVYKHYLTNGRYIFLLKKTIFGVWRPLRYMYIHSLAPMIAIFNSHIVQWHLIQQWVFNSTTRLGNNLVNKTIGGKKGVNFKYYLSGHQANDYRGCHACWITKYLLDNMLICFISTSMFKWLTLYVYVCIIPPLRMHHIGVQP